MSYKIEDVRPKFELRNRNYVVTGGAQGIGFAVTHAICEMGGNVAVWDVQAQPVDEFKDLSLKFGVKTLYIQTDVTKQEAITAAMERTMAEFGSLDGCVPAAGIAIDKPFIDQTWDEFTRIQEINVSIPCRGGIPPQNSCNYSSLMSIAGQRSVFRGPNSCKAAP